MKYRSKHLKAGMILAAPGKGESSTDNVFSGLCMIAESGAVLASDEKEDCFVVSEIDVDYLENLRLKERSLPPTASCTPAFSGTARKLRPCSPALTASFPIFPSWRRTWATTAAA